MSKNRRILISGAPGVGKTTLCLYLLQALTASGFDVGGFCTEEVRNECNQRIGFDVVTVDGERGTLARVTNKRGPRVGKYSVDLQSFESIVLDAMGRREMMVIDEVGKMELLSKPFCDRLKYVFGGGGGIIASIPQNKRPHVVDELFWRDDVVVYELNMNNRDKALDHILDMLNLTQRSSSVSNR